MATNIYTLRCLRFAFLISACVLGLLDTVRLTNLADQCFLTPD